MSSQKLDVGLEGHLKNDYLYNGKELVDDADLDWYDYGYRNYDAQIGRFPQLDPLTWQFPMLTNYQYASCDPILNIDLDGLEGVVAGENLLPGVVVTSAARTGSVVKDLIPAALETIHAFQYFNFNGTSSFLNTANLGPTHYNGDPTKDYDPREMYYEGAAPCPGCTGTSGGGSGSFDGTFHTNFWGRMKNLGELTGPASGISAIYGIINSAHIFLGSRYDLTGRQVSENERMLAAVNTLSLPLSAIGGGAPEALEESSVFRFDTRNPSQISEEGGFNSWGNNENLNLHVKGYTTESKTSAYISTSKTFEGAQYYADGSSGYIYEVKYRGNGTDVNSWYHSQGRFPDFPNEEEIAIPNHIPFKDIKNVTPH